MWLQTKMEVRQIEVAGFNESSGLQSKMIGFWIRLD